MTVRVNKQPFNIREKLSELERPIGVKGHELMRAETAQDARDLVSAGRRNFIINGSFQIWQRSTDYDNSGGGWGYFSVDRYRSNRGRIRQVTATIDGREVKALEISPGAGGYNGGRGILQKVEDYKIYNKVTTISAYIKSNVPSKATFGSIYNHSTSANVPNSGKTINITTEFQKFEVTNPSFDPTTSPDTYIITDLIAGVTYTIANVQLEYGKNATDFEHRSYSEELALCQRYYWEVGSYVNNNWAPITLVIAYNGTRAFGSIPTPVTMRAHPAVTFSQLNVYSSSSAIDVTNIYRYSQTNRDQEYNGLAFEVNTASGMSGGSVYRLHVKNVSGTSGYIRLNAEL